MWYNVVHGKGMMDLRNTSGLRGAMAVFRGGEKESTQVNRAARPRILLVDDERAVRTSLAASLSEAGYLVRGVRSGEEALRVLREGERPDLVLLDVMMPGRDGFSTCAEIRSLDRDLPIVFLSALDEERDQIRGLEVGADDYVSKSASQAMLCARIGKALERVAHLARIDAPPSMTKTEAGIFRLLASERGRYFSYREIFAAVCGEGYVGDEAAIRVHVSHMRRKIPSSSLRASIRRASTTNSPT